MLRRVERYRSRSNIIRASEGLRSNRHVMVWVIVDVLSYADVWQSRPASHGKDNAHSRFILTGSCDAALNLTHIYPNPIFVLICSSQSLYFHTELPAHYG